MTLSKTFRNGAKVVVDYSGIEGPVRHYYKVVITEPEQIQRVSYHTTMKDARKVWKAEIRRIASR